jgi:hypothetical protein
MHGRPPRFLGSIVIRDRQSTRGRYASGRDRLWVDLGLPWPDPHWIHTLRDAIAPANQVVESITGSITGASTTIT